MNSITNLIRLFALALVTILSVTSLYAQDEINALQPINGSSNVNIGILKWTVKEGCLYDLHFGTTQSPTLYKSGLQTGEEKPVVLELNKTYYWKVVEKKDGKETRSSKIFSFSTLPITLNPSVKYNSFVDLRDYKVYWTTNIDGKEWMVQNLDYDLPSFSFYYDNSEANKVYGKLYLGEALTGKQKEICPEGWHIPTREEWENLLKISGGYKSAGVAIKESSAKYWRTSNFARSNSSGMTILPAGSRDSKPSYSNMGKYTFFWTSTPDVKTPGSFYNIDIGFMRDGVINNPGDKNWSYSIRCLKD